MHETSFVWAGTLSLVMLAVIMLAFIVPQVDDFHDDWRDYAHETRYGGQCSDPDPSTRPDECDSDPPVEMWQFVPWLLAAGTAAAMLIICWPRELLLRRRQPEE